MKAPFLIGRILFGGYFLYNGIRERRMLAGYAGSKNVPMPETAVAVTGAALILGGASILAGVKPKLGTAALIGFLAGVSPVMHDFWHAEEPKQRMDDTIQFTKNMALMGGALALMGVNEPWPTSVPTSKPTRFERIRNLVNASILA